MKKFTSIITFMLIFSSLVRADAKWDTIAYFNQVVSDLKTFNGALFVGGNITKVNGNTSYWSAYYNGSSWTRHTSMVGGSGIDQFAVFNNQLYAADALEHYMSMGVSVWNGSSWDDGGSTNRNHYFIYADGADYLYVIDSQGNIRRRTPTSGFTNFNSVINSNSIGCLIRYQDKMIFAGTFESINGVAAKNIIQWDGVSWTPLGTGVVGGIGCMEVYNNELYVCGMNLTSAGGVPVSMIAKWNGSSWSDVGGGVTSDCWNGIRDLKAINAGLLMVGDFSQVGGVNANNIALWDGTKWIDYGITHDDSFINCAEEYNNELYVGSFDFTKSHLFKLVSLTGATENNIKENVKLYPNPVVNSLNITIPEYFKSATVSLLNLNGQELTSQQLLQNNVVIDMSGLSSGIYFVKVVSDTFIEVKKIIKE